MRRDAVARAKAESITVAEWAERWLAGLEAEGRSPGTTRSYRSTVKLHVLPSLGPARLLDVTPEAVDAAVAAVKTPGARNNTVRALSSMFRAAVTDRTVPLIVSPVEVRAPKVKISDHLDSADVASPAEVKAMTEAMPDRLALAVPLAAWCSLRLGEVLGLQRRDFENLDQPGKAALYVRRQWHTKTSPPAYGPPKAGSARKVSIPASLVPAIVDHLDRHTPQAADAPLLPSPRNPKAPVSQTAFDGAWRAARKDVRPGFRFHALRHTGLTMYAQQGATLEEIKRRGGHRNLDAALRYQHATAERDRAITDKLNEMIGES